jgi:capsular polysaccharide transport system permease protein
MPSNTSSQDSGGLRRSSPLEVNRRVIGALLIRELLTRYGRSNIGFLWLFVEPTAFILIVSIVWSKFRGNQVSDIPIVAFAITGYSTMLMWRYAVGRCLNALKSNKPLLYHRQVRILDIYVARILLEEMAMTMALIALTIVFYSIDWLPLPEDVLQVFVGWLLLCWLTFGLALTIGGLAERWDVVARTWHPLSYILMAASGVAFTVNALPPGAQRLALWNPIINTVEYLREGWFGSVMHAHYDLGYVFACNIVLMLVGISLVGQIGIETDSPDE